MATHAITVYGLIPETDDWQADLAADTRRGNAILSDEHSASSYGQPVLVYDGRAWSRAEAYATGLTVGCAHYQADEQYDEHDDADEQRLCRAWHRAPMIVEA